MPDRKKAFGNWGEAMTKEYLRRHHYAIVAANQRIGRLEIDLIARQKDELVFIEVKTRRESAFVATAAPLAPKQVNNLKRAITAYCTKNLFDPEAVRLDLIIVIADRASQKVKFKHYRDIF